MFAVWCSAAAALLAYAVTTNLSVSLLLRCQPRMMAQSLVSTQRAACSPPPRLSGWSAGSSPERRRPARFAPALLAGVERGSDEPALHPDKRGGGGRRVGHT